ncbi:hypothetical protein [Flavihumibacter fluvii]|uniref:hypothetical protein n=1 Tax=Flavihumibacter fluvii TaxID=2838157 RepID=UPI001BDEF1FA|nr:hypothetical protein [Flavihumibacter fluvii]ULQ52151.1 hypothetical protein KJS93_18835 [Flavihumibacter fluvii]
MKYFSLCIVFILFTFSLVAQGRKESLNSIDSSFIHILSKELAFPDSISLKLIEASYEFHSRCQLVIMDPLRSTDNVSETILLLRDIHMKNIKTILGDEKFEMYLAFVRRRMKADGINDKPLSQNN